MQTCTHVFERNTKNGQKRGDVCGKPSREDKCRTHKETNYKKHLEYLQSKHVSKKSICQHKFIIGGPNKIGTICGRSCNDGDRCGVHKIKRAKTKNYTGSKSSKKINIMKNKYAEKRPSYTNIGKKELDGVCMYVILRGDRAGKHCLNFTRKGDRCKLHTEKYLEKKKERNINAYDINNAKMVKLVQRDIDNNKIVDVEKFLEKKKKLLADYLSVSKKINGINIFLGKTTKDSVLEKHFKFYNEKWYLATKQKINKKYPGITDEDFGEKMKEKIDEFIVESRDDGECDFKIEYPYIKYKQIKDDIDNLETVNLLAKYCNKKDRKMKELNNIIKIINIIKKS